MTEFGIIDWAEVRDPISREIDIAKAAEANGFQSLWLWDTPLYTKDAYVALTAAALNTEKLRLGPGVSNPMTRHLSISVNAISTLDDLSGGRAFLGFGNGAPGSANVLGFPTPRVAQFRTSVERLCTLMRGEEVDMDGARFRIPSVRRRVPIYIAAWGPRMLRLTGELTDGALIAGPAEKELMAWQIEQVREGARAASRDPSDLRINLMLHVSCDPDPKAAVNAVKPLVAYNISRAPLRWADQMPAQYADDIRKVQQEYALRNSPSYRGPDAQALVTDSLASALAIVGTEEECRRRVAEILTLQPDEVTFALLDGDKLQQIETLAGLIPRA